MVWIKNDLLKEDTQKTLECLLAVEAPRAPKLSYFDGRAPQLRARVNHGTPAAGVIGHIYNLQVVILFSFNQYIYVTIQNVKLATLDWSKQTGQVFCRLSLEKS